MSNPKENADELAKVVEGLESTYNDIIISMVARVQEGLNLIESMENLKSAMPSKRVQDLNTLYCLQSLMEAQKPREVKLGDETQYEAVFTPDEIEAMKKTVKRIHTQIYREYGKKEEEDGR